MEFIIILLLIFLLFVSLKRKQKKNALNTDFERKVVSAVDKSISFTNHNIKKLKREIDKRSSLNYITNSTWIYSDVNNNEISYTFKNDGTLLISVNGIVKHCKYELISDHSSLIITCDNLSELYDITNLKDDLLYLFKISSKEEILLFNKTKVREELTVKIEMQNQSKNQEKQKYFYSEEPDFIFLASSLNWKDKNPNSSIFDFVNHLEQKYIDQYDYNIWKSYYPNNQRLDYGRFLIEKTNDYKD